MDDYGRLVRLLMLTGARVSEWTAAERRWIKGDVLVVLGEHYKNGFPHWLPLTSEVRKIIDSARVIAGRDLLVWPGMLSRKKTALDQVSGVEGWILHDLRRTFRTRVVSECGVDAFIAERCMGHALPGLHGVYDQGLHLEPKRKALEAWQARLHKIVGERPA